MDVFQSPLEALVFNFNCVSFGFLPTTVQSLLTFVAVLTAVVCFWRIKAVGSNSSFRPTTKSSSSGDGDDFPPTFHFDGHSSSTPPLPVSSLSTHPPPYHLSSEKKPSEQENEDGCSTCNCPIEDDEDDDDSNGFMAGEGCRVKGKFTLYYSKELDKIGEEDPIDDVDVDVDVDVVCSSGGPELLYSNVGRWSCDRIWVRRSGRGDLGWYRYQDLTVLNGSVVRLWECHSNRR